MRLTDSTKQGNPRQVSGLDHVKHHLAGHWLIAARYVDVALVQLQHRVMLTWSDTITLF